MDRALKHTDSDLGPGRTPLPGRRICFPRILIPLGSTGAVVDFLVSVVVMFLLCLGLERGEFADAARACQAVRVVHRLYRAFAGEESLPTAERAFIRRDAAAQMLRVPAPWRGTPRTWAALATAMRLSPGLVGRRMARKALPTFRRPFWSRRGTS
jgi:hypothetical protein